LRVLLTNAQEKQTIVDFNKKEHGNITALKVACVKGHLSIVEELFNHPYSKNQIEFTADELQVFFYLFMFFLC